MTGPRFDPGADFDWEVVDVRATADARFDHFVRAVSLLLAAVGMTILAIGALRHAA